MRWMWSDYRYCLHATKLCMSWSLPTVCCHAYCVVFFLQLLVHAIQAILFENGSFIKQMTIVDSQVVLSAFWDVPRELQSEAQLTHVREQQHVETCLLALSVAVALRDKLNALCSMSSSIGITTGTACVGVRGCDTRSDLAIIGR